MTKRMRTSCARSSAARVRKKKPRHRVPCRSTRAAAPVIRRRKRAEPEPAPEPEPDRGRSGAVVIEPERSADGDRPPNSSVAEAAQPKSSSQSLEVPVEPAPAEGASRPRRCEGGREGWTPDARGKERRSRGCSRREDRTPAQARARGRQPQASRSGSPGRRRWEGARGRDDTGP